MFGLQSAYRKGNGMGRVAVKVFACICCQYRIIVFI